jgi:hypothetical protein
VNFDVCPESHAKLFDYLAARFGIGDWHIDDERQYHKYRMTEIAKIKAVCKKRRIEIEEIWLAGEYCIANDKPVLHWISLTKHIPDAKRQAAERRRVTQVVDLDDAIEEALRWERSFMGPGSADWISRLARAATGVREEVLAEWTLARGVGSSPSSSAG